MPPGLSPWRSRRAVPRGSSPRQPLRLRAVPASVATRDKEHSALTGRLSYDILVSMSRPSGEDQLPVFDWTAIPCASREEAEAEAGRRQATESTDAEWTFLQIDRQWVARRTPADPAAFQPPPGWKEHRGPLWKRTIDWMMDSSADQGFH